jgi:hypothetical protein
VAKQTGIGARLYAGAYDISGDTGAIDAIGMSRTQIDVTGLDKDFVERLPGLGDGVISFTGFFNPTNAHAALSPIGTAARTVTAAFGTAVGSPAASLTGAQASYTTTRGVDGSVATSAQFLSQGGFGTEWGSLLTAGTVSASGTGTALDGTAASTGGAAYLHVFSVTAGTATVVVEHSTTGTASWSTILTFTATAAGTAQRVSTASTINRYARYNISGGTAVIAVNLHRD